MSIMRSTTNSAAAVIFLLAIIYLIVVSHASRMLWIIYGNRCVFFPGFLLSFSILFLLTFELNRGASRGFVRGSVHSHLIVSGSYLIGPLSQMGNIAAHWFCAKVHRFILNRSIFLHHPSDFTFTQCDRETLIFDFNYAYISHWKSFPLCLCEREGEWVSQNLHAFKSDCWRRQNENEIKINYSLQANFASKQKQPDWVHERREKNCIVQF